MVSTMKQIRAMIVAGAVAVCGIGLVAYDQGGFSSQAAVVTWNMPVPYGDKNFHTLNHVAFAEDLQKRTGGSVTVKVHPSGSLFKHPDIKNAVRSGQVPIGEFLLSRLSNEDPIFALDSIPFLADSYEDAEKLWSVARPSVERLLDKQGLKVLYAVPWPPQGLYANKPVPVASEMAGLKFRAYNSATERLAQLLKAVPTQVEVADLSQAFSTGRVDAMVTSPSTGYNSKAWDYLSHYYDVQAWLPKNIVVMNKAVFEGLDKDTQASVLTAAKEAEARGWSASRKETKTKTEGLAANGIHVSKPSEGLKSALVGVGQTMVDEWLSKTGSAGKDIIEEYQE